MSMTSIPVSSRVIARAASPEPVERSSLCLAVIACVTLALGAALAGFWSGGGVFQILLAYMGGGWLGLTLAVLPRLSPRAAHRPR